MLLSVVAPTSAIASALLVVPTAVLSRCWVGAGKVVFVGLSVPGAPASSRLTCAGRMSALPGRSRHTPVREDTSVHLAPVALVQALGVGDPDQAVPERV